MHEVSPFLNHLGWLILILWIVGHFGLLIKISGHCNPPSRYEESPHIIGCATIVGMLAWLPFMLFFSRIDLFSFFSGIVGLTLVAISWRSFYQLRKIAKEGGDDD